MSYFSKIPLTTYEFNSKVSVVKDIMRRVAFLSEVPIRNLYDIYTIEDGDTPESIALSIYGATTYHWIIMLFNEIHNPYLDWPIDQNVINYYCEKKYGLDTDGEFLMLKVSHYEYENQIIGEFNTWVSGITWVPPTVPRDLEGNIIQQAYPVTFYEYEQQLNDKKRIIKILKPELLGSFVRQFEAQINV